jgi:hypothetical protein
VDLLDQILKEVDSMDGSLYHPNIRLNRLASDLVIKMDDLRYAVGILGVDNGRLKRKFV